MVRSFNKCFGLFSDENGTSVIELAILSPFAAVLLLGMVDTSLAFTEKLKTEQAAQRAIEKATSYNGAGSDYSGLDDEAAIAADVPLDNVTLEKWLECNSTRQDSFNDVCADGELITRHIAITITDTYSPLFSYGPLGQLVGADNQGNIPYSVDAQVRIQ